LNGNGIPDRMEKGHGLSDLNGNGIPDRFEGQRGFQGQQFGQFAQGQQFGSTGMTTSTQVLLPTQVIEKPAAIHEEIRREQVEEIQPVINVEKLKTEVIQKTQPLIDREVRPVTLTQRSLPTETLPTIQQRDIGLRAAEDISSVVYKDSAAMVVERPALVSEIERVQIIEEIQPVIYKETIVPSLIKETKPVYQTIVEGTTYVHQTLPAQPLKTSAWSGRTWTNDMNGNGIPDQFERQGLTSGLNQGLSSGFNQDLNGNGIPDKLEQQNMAQNPQFSNVRSL